MKSLVVIFLIFSFAAAAIFSLLAMNHGLDHAAGAGGCFGALTQKIDCQKVIDPLVFFNFHLNAFRSFSTAVFGQNLPSLLWLIVLFLIGWLWLLIKPVGPNAVNFHPLLKTSPESAVSVPLSPLRRWLARHEHSPTIFLS